MLCGFKVRQLSPIYRIDGKCLITGDPTAGTLTGHKNPCLNGVQVVHAHCAPFTVYGTAEDTGLSMI